MQITVSNIPPEGLHRELSRDEEWFNRQSSENTLNDCTVKHIEIHCFISRVSKNVTVKGTITTNLAARCCRCLEEFELSIKDDFKYVLVPAPIEGKEEELELSRDDLDFGYYEHDSIDLQPLIVEQVMLQIPFKPLCSESCRGLCPTCGINLNKESCNHKGEEKRSPFAILENFKVK